MTKGMSQWVPHAGGPCPVADDAEVIVIRRRFVGDVPDYGSGPAAGFDWQHDNEDPGDDVVAYKSLSGSS